MASAYLESDMRIDEAAKQCMKQEQKNVYDMKEIDIRYFENMLADEKAKRERLADDIRACLGEAGELVTAEQILQELTGSGERDNLQKLLELAKDDNHEAVELQARVEKMFPYYIEETPSVAERKAPKLTA